MKQFNTILSFLLVLGISVIFCTGAEAGGSAGQIITFDVPGSACLPAFRVCTQAFAINSSGAVVGTYSDASQAIHGFLRDADGSFIGIDPPGATCGGPFTLCSQPSAINDGGAIVGFYVDPTGAHPYIRANDGSFTTFDVPGAFCCTAPVGINQEGTVIGSFQDSNGTIHEFSRSRDGKFSVFDVPGAVNGASVVGINPEGTIVGYYFDANSNGHGFVRFADGTILSFDPPGSQNTSATGINPAGAIVGTYQDQNFVTHGFVHNSNGSFTSFDATNPPFVTNPVGITPGGVIGGSCQSPFQSCGGFVRARDGSITLFNPPSTILTRVTGISGAGSIAGWYDDVGYLQHAFIRVPSPLQATAAGN